ncbi:ABC-type antimicrobial peptide transport system, permease component [hydrothermal vent metagenome]|uniref:ABC-type antimicrobial peptide transport system, permease component n=1 Tax=hydrothermal vent metagenome TaxID=652676 RepID=A0A3B1D534_9ZZZZ
MFWIIFRVAIRELRGAWLRSLLTMLGVVIGVAAVVAMVALGEGAKRSIADNIRNLGTNLLIIRPGLMGKRHVRRVPAQTLTFSDSELIRRRIRHIVSVSPSNAQSAQVKYKNKNTNTNIVGVTPDYISARSLEISQGRFFTMRDLGSARRVATVGKSVAEHLFGFRSPIGKYIKINGINFMVTAVLSEKGQSGWWDADDQILIPLTAYQKRLFGGSSVSAIWVEVEDEDLMDYVKGRIENILTRAHKLRDKDKRDFHVRSQVDIMKSMEEMTKTFTYLLGGIAAISLLVGGIGIMNIMLVTVTERTREIGLRKAIGAKRRDILKQFLLESITLTSLGGGIGILFGMAAAWAIGEFTDWDTYVATNSVVIAYSVALVVGIFFGWYPAWKAARLSPVDALRRE